jgi:antitoxin VapB
MSDEHENRLREMRQGFKHAAPLGDLPAGKQNPLRAKIFKSGNSLALRLPAALGLEAGIEMELTVEPDGSYSLKQAPPAKRKIDISKFAGKAPWLKPLPPEMREFEERELDWHLLEKGGESA